MRKYRKLPATCANCRWSPRGSIHCGWIFCPIRRKRVRCSSRPCMLYINEHFTPHVS